MTPASYFLATTELYGLRSVYCRAAALRKRPIKDGYVAFFVRGASMSTIAGSARQWETTTNQSVSICNVAWCVFWMILLVTASGCAFMAATVPDEGRVLLFFVFYALQALVAESLGVRVSASNISAPRRFWFLPPWVVLWRTKRSLDDLKNVTSMSSDKGQLLRLKWMSGAKISIIFSSRDKKLQFIQIVHQLRPHVSIYKEGRCPA
jgi:hypothetical protein